MATGLDTIGWVDAGLALVIGLVLGRVAARAASADRSGREPMPGSTGGARYRPVLEGLAVLVAVAIVARHGLSWRAAPNAVVVTAALATSVTDLRHRRIPDRIVFPAIGLCATTMSVATVASGEPERLLAAGAGAGLYAGTLLVVHLLTPDGMGRGDVKLAVLLGAAIGWLQPISLATVELVLVALCGASAVGLLLALAAIVDRRRRPSPDPGSIRELRIPFGPAMSVAALAVVLFGDQMVR